MSGEFRLSPQQERLWSLGDEDSKTTPFYVQGVLRLKGALRPSDLEAAINTLIARHEILRTTFPSVKGLTLPLQAIAESGTATLGEGAASEQEPRAVDDPRRQGVLPEAGRMAHDPEIELPLAATLHRLAPEEHLLVIRLPALCADGFTVQQLLKELATTYRSEDTGSQAGDRTEKDDDEGLQFADVAEWQHEILASEEMEAGRRFWRDQKIGQAHVSRLPFAMHSEDADFAPRRQRLEGSSETVEGLMKQIRRADAEASLDGVLFAAWRLLSWRLGDGVEQVVGRLCDGRSYEELATTMGPLERYLPMHGPSDSELSFLDFLDRQEKAWAELYGSQEYFSWSEIDDGDEEQRFCSLAFEHRRWPALESENPEFLPEALYACIDPFELKLAAVEDATGGWAMALDHDPRVYSAADVDRLGRQWLHLLEQLARRPQARLGELSLLTEEERRQLVIEWNRSDSIHDDGARVHRRVERCAAEFPDRTALVYEDVRLDYRELNARANRLARHLRAFGAGPERVVGVCLERSEQVILSFLGILKAGGAYLPLDPSLPLERLRFMLRDSAAAALVSERRLRPELVLDGMVRVDLDAAAAVISKLPGDDLDAADLGSEPANSSLAYLLFTSGSTGTPKAVGVEQRQLDSYVRAVAERLAVPQESSWATVSTFGADLGNTAIYGALTAGGCLHVISQDRLFDPDSFAAYMQRERVDCLKVVPSHLEALMGGAQPAGVLPRRCLVIGGEAARWDWIEELRRLAPGCRIVNHYGPTETTVGVLTREVGSQVAADRGPTRFGPPIGRPLSGVRAYLLDAAGRPLPMWVTGELYLGGATVSRGYFGRPGLTAERFLPDAFAVEGEAGGRLYRTGDRARHLPGGDLELLGRMDHQVKIHGFRVEIGEIESSLASHPAVEQCAVLARDDDGNGQLRLVAYLVAAQEVPTIEELRRHLRTQLPEFMIPTAFVDLPAMPLNPNGKIDRSRLPAPDSGKLRSRQDYVAPATVTEEVLAEIWSEVLGLERVGIHDNFFHLGGDSIRSIELRARARRKDLDFTIAEVFQHQTIHRLATVLEGRESSGERTESYEPFQLISQADRERLPEDVEDAYPLSMMQQGMLFHSLYSADRATYHDVGSYRFRMPYDEKALRVAAGRLVARHPALRTSFDYSSFEQPLQLVHRRAEIPVKTDDWSHHDPSQERAVWDEWIDRETRRSFPWNQAPLLRLYLHRLWDGGCQITVSFHHAILDGWSRHSMVTELFSEYLQQLDYDVPALAEQPPLSYGEFVGLERQALTSEQTQEFWRRQLEGAPRTTVPRRPGKQAADGGLEARVHITTLPSDLSERLHALAQELGTPIKSVLLAAHLRVLSLLSGSDDVTTGLVVNGRPEVDAGDRVFGLFLNSVPLRGRLTGGSWRDLIRMAFHAESSLLPHRRFPIAELQRLYGGGERLLEINFNYMHYHIYRRVLEMPGLEFLDYKGFEETNLTCVVNFHQDPISHDIQLGIEYHAAVLYEEQIESMARYLSAILEEMALRPGSRYEVFSPLSPGERHQLLREWNDTMAPDDGEVLLHQMVERQAAATPDLTAVEHGEQRLSYAELVTSAAALATELRRRAVGVETPVVLVMERSPELVVALLAVPMAGGAYVPVEPDLPRPRIERILADVAPPVVLTQPRFRAEVPEGRHEVLELPLENDDGRDRSEHGRDRQPQIRSANAVYTIYTSGSTGSPKGVVNTHRGIVNRLLWMQRRYGLGTEDRVLQKTPYTFDVSVWEFFWPLAVGARLVLADPGGHRDGAYLAQLIEEREITTLHFVPSMLQLFLEEPLASTSCSSLRRVICSGEALPAALERRATEMLGGQLHNLYGPTEAAIDVTSWACSRSEAGLSVPIGRPIDNLAIYLLDRHCLPVPVGVPGHLHIAGAGLARGYLRRAALSADRFIPDPWSGKPGGRLYKSGDLARFHLDGAIEFLTRIDHQVKIRGLRIELGEIEAELRRHPAVREAVVMARGESVERILVGYYVVDDEASTRPDEVRESLRKVLPEYMVPNHLIPLQELPLTANGKLDRAALPAPERVARDVEGDHLPPASELERTLAAIWREVLELDEVGVNRSFFDLGGHSLHLVRVHVKLREALGREVPMTDLFQFPTIRALAEHLGGAGEALRAPELGRRRALSRSRSGRSEDRDIAVVGMSCRLPGADSVEELWRNLEGGVESVVRLTDEELLEVGVEPELLRRPDYVKAKGVLEQIDLFDAEFFNFSPMEASILDPQQRLFLECAWQAMENSGQIGDHAALETAVFAGIGMNTYAFNVYSNRRVLESIGGYQAMLANDKDFLATRVSYKLDLRGPSLTVQSACSTSLVAIHLACQSLIHGEADMALAGGVRVAVPHKSGYLYEEGGIHAIDGHCRAFDAAATGTVGGDGVGVVVLKRLADALAEGDSIRAVIRGSAVNNDGARRVGYTAPGIEGQAQVISEAFAVAGVEPQSVHYVEAHGTGTELGDPIEVAALSQAFRAGTEESGFCALGSLKTNVGHLDAAAGVAGLIKVVLMLENRRLVPSLHFERPNPRIDFADSPFYVNTESRPWDRCEQPRRAGLSSMGIGGTNAHLIVEEAPPQAASETSREWQWLPLSARSVGALEKQTDSLAEVLTKSPELELPDVAYTLKIGRRSFQHRRVVVCRDLEEAAAALRERDRKRVSTTMEVSGEGRSVAFLLPGQGSQHPGMALGIYREEAVFRRHFDRCADVLHPLLGLDLRRLLEPTRETGEAAATLRQTRIAQPALFAVEYALAELWRSWGLEPAALLGHSVGEYVAAALAEVWSLEDALGLVAERGRWMQEMPPGAMLSVSAPAAEIESQLGTELALAAINTADGCTVSGPEPAIEAFATKLAATAIDHRRLVTSHAFHSPMMAPAAERFARTVARVEARPPKIPFLSNLTGDWIRAEEAVDPEYWTRHLLHTVRFADGLSKLLDEPRRVLLEVGPGRTLSTFARRHPMRQKDQPILQSLPHPADSRSDREWLARAAAEIWLAGIELPPRSYYADERRRRVPLPTYPFERKRFWIERPKQPWGSDGDDGATSLVRLPEIEDWFYAPQWRASPKPEEQVEEAESAPVGLLLSEEHDLGRALALALKGRVPRVIPVFAGEDFEERSDGSFTVNPGRRTNFDRLLDRLTEDGPPPSRWIHLWSVEKPTNEDGMQDQGLAGLLHLAQTLERAPSARPAEIMVVVSGLEEIGGLEAIYPQRSALAAACRVVSQEIPDLPCRLVDVVLPPEGSYRRARLGELLAAELMAPPQPLRIAYRGGQRWLESYVRQPLPVPFPDAGSRREGGVHLLGGGVGSMSSAIGRWLAQLSPGAHLVVLEASESSPEDSDSSDPSRQTAAQALVADCRELGAEVEIVPIDFDDTDALRVALESRVERLGRFDTVIYAPVGGTGEPSPIAELDAAHLTAHLEVHLRQLDTLIAALDGLAPKRGLAVTSNAAVLGGLGALPATALSCVVDARIAELVRSAETPWTRVHWDYWSVEERQSSELESSATEGYDLNEEEGREVLERLLRYPGAGHLAISPIDLRARLAVWVTGRASTEEPTVQHARPDLEQGFVAPRDALEEQVAEIWQELLGIEEIGVHDDFFDLGGHSLLATQLSSRLHSAFQVSIPLRDLFEAPTVAELAQKILHLQLEVSGEDAVTELLAEVSSMSPTELDALLAEEKNLRSPESRT